MPPPLGFPVLSGRADDPNRVSRWRWRSAGLLRRFASALAAIGCFGWLAGLAVFVAALPTEDARQSGKSDCAVIFSGRHARAIEGIGAISAMAPRRVLISGYGFGMGWRELEEVRAVDPALTGCCLDIDDRARNTRENGIETARWAGRLNCASVALITDDYHMPRALMELGENLGDVPIVPVAVPMLAHTDMRARTRLVLQEYHKILFRLGQRGL